MIPDKYVATGISWAETSGPPRARIVVSDRYVVDAPSGVDALLDDRRGEPAFDAAVAALSAGPQGSTDDSFNDWQQISAPAGCARWTGVEQAHARMGTLEPGRGASLLQHDPPLDLPARLRLVNPPVLVIAGAQDCFTGTAPLVALAALFPNGGCVVIDGCGHYPWVEQPSAFRAAANRFLATIAQPAVESSEPSTDL